ncbi:hypothetical protein [Viscerimonas tarda]
MNTQRQLNAQGGTFTRPATREEKAFARFARELKKENGFAREEIQEIIGYHKTESRALNFYLNGFYPFNRA